MASGRRVAARAPCRTMPTRLGALAVIAAALVFGGSALASGAGSTVASTLYAKNDPWKPYLASEKICPGGERTDLPVAAQLETVACLVNFARQRRGLSRLDVLPQLNGASRAKANQIVRCAAFAHNPCGAGWTSSVRSTGYRGRVAENLYLASRSLGAPRVAVDAWLNSPPHRKTLFGRSWRTQGFALIFRRSVAGYADVSLWVITLGER